MIDREKQVDLRTKRKTLHLYLSKKVIGG